MKRIMISVLTIAVVGLMAREATAAYFSSTITNSGNTFGTGTMRLTVNGQDQAGQTVVFNEGNLAPGDIIPEHTFVVANVGTINGDHLDLEVTLSGDTDLAKYIVFSDNGSNGLRFGSTQDGTQSVRLDVPGWTAGDSEYGLRNGLNGDYIFGPNAVAPLTTGPGNGMDRADGDGKVTLNDLAAGKVRIIPGTVNAGIFAGTSATLWLNGKLDPSTPDSMQGKTVTASFVWTLHQNSSQF